jgi:hypothetical protein
LLDGLGVLVPLPDPVRVLPAPPPRESDDVAWGVLIDEYQMRQVALEVTHIKPHLTRVAKPLRLCAGLQPSVPETVTTFSAADIGSSLSCLFGSVFFEIVIQFRIEPMPRLK